MSAEAKRYTAQEMRELSNKIWDYEKMSSGLELTINDKDYVDCEATQNLIAMLRQAADTEEELAELKARMKAVVKECNRQRPKNFEIADTAIITLLEIDRKIAAILRVASGEGGQP